MTFGRSTPAPPRLTFFFGEGGPSPPPPSFLSAPASSPQTDIFWRRGGGVQNTNQPQKLWPNRLWPVLVFWCFWPKEPKPQKTHTLNLGRGGRPFGAPPFGPHFILGLALLWLWLLWLLLVWTSLDHLPQDPPPPLDPPPPPDRPKFRSGASHDSPRTPNVHI